MRRVDELRQLADDDWDACDRGGLRDARSHESTTEDGTDSIVCDTFLYLRNHLMAMLAHGCDSSRRFWANELGSCFPSQFMASWRLS